MQELHTPLIVYVRSKTACESAYFPQMSVKEVWETEAWLQLYLLDTVWKLGRPSQSVADYTVVDAYKVLVQQVPFQRLVMFGVHVPS